MGGQYLDLVEAAGAPRRGRRPPGPDLQVGQVHHRAAAAPRPGPGRRRPGLAGATRPTGCRWARPSSCATTSSGCSAPPRSPASRPGTTCARARRPTWSGPPARRPGRPGAGGALGNAKLSEDEVAELRRLLTGCGAVDDTEARIGELLAEAKAAWPPPAGSTRRPGPPWRRWPTTSPTGTPERPWPGGRWSSGPVWPACRPPSTWPPAATWSWSRPRRSRAAAAARSGSRRPPPTRPSVLTMPEVVRERRRRRGAGGLARAGPAGPDLPAHLPRRQPPGRPPWPRADGGRGRAARRPRGGRPLPGLPRPPGADAGGRVGPVHRPQPRRPGRPAAAPGPGPAGPPRRVPAAAQPGRHPPERLAAAAPTFQALYTGLSPFDALGIYAVVAHMDTVGGAFFPAGAAARTPGPGPGRGGREAGAGFRYSTRVERVEGGPGGVTGWCWPAASAWPPPTWSSPATCRPPTPPAAAAARDWRVQRRRHFSPSCYLVHLGLTRQLGAGPPPCTWAATGRPPSRP